MRWTPKGRSANLEDMRGSSGRRGGALPKMGIGGFLLLLVLSFIFKKDFFALVGGGGVTDGQAVQEAPVATTPQEEELIQFVSFVLDDTQKVWTEIFASSGQTYQPAKLAIFTEGVSSGCGFADSAVGPFYCPADGQVYVDLSFYEALRQRFGAPGDFAQAYVLAHEVGHHVQNLLGLSNNFRRLQGENPDQANQISVLQELQADCLAGIWAHSTAKRDLLQEGDVEEALGAAAAVGDDRIQEQATGRVNPESWTHGSSELRMKWFQAGFQSGDVNRCDTLARQ